MNCSFYEMVIILRQTVYLLFKIFYLLDAMQRHIKITRQVHVTIKWKTQQVDAG